MIGEALLRAAGWLVRKAGAGNLLSQALLLSLLLTLAWGLGNHIRGLESSGMWVIAALGMYAGWLLGRVRWQGWQAAVTAAALGLVLALARLGRPVEPLLALLRSTPALFWQVVRLSGENDSVLPTFQPLFQDLWMTLSAPAARSIDWAAGLARGQPAYDPVATVFWWSLLVWVLSVWAAWAIRRRIQPLPAVLPAGLILAVVLNYSRSGLFLLLSYLAGTLLLCGLIYYRRQEQRWEATGVDFSEDLRFDVSLAIVSLALLATTLSSIAPTLDIRRWIQTGRGFTEDGIEHSEAVAKSLGLNPPPVERPAFSNLASPGLPRSHLLGAGPELSEQVVMLIQVEGPAPLDQAAPGIYWRGLAYDRYTGLGWATSRIETHAHSPGDPLPALETPAQGELRQRIEIASKPDGSSGWLLYAAGQPVLVESATQVAQRSNDDLFGMLVTDPEYSVVSFVGQPDENQLRSAGQDYPLWIQRRYLSLPEGVPNRVLGLGRDLTAAALTPYDRALAIESYLRKIPYSLDVPTPPSGRDVSDYFLFDLRRGYCDYYATAMVVLARAAGLPARLVIGYASGTFLPELNSYQVTAADAHSWAEVYFPGYGWVEFEPTGGRPSIQRPSEGTPSKAPNPPRLPVEEAGPGFEVDREKLLSLIAAMVALLAILSFAWAAWDAWRLRHFSPSKTIFTLYTRLYRFGRHLAPLHPAVTPHELAASLGKRLLETLQRSRLPGMSRPAAREIEWLSGVYARAAYSLHPPDRVEQAQAISTWRRLRWRLWLSRLLKSIRYN